MPSTASFQHRSPQSHVRPRRPHFPVPILEPRTVDGTKRRRVLVVDPGLNVRCRKGNSLIARRASGCPRRPRERSEGTSDHQHRYSIPRTLPTRPRRDTRQLRYGGSNRPSPLDLIRSLTGDAYSNVLSCPVDRRSPLRLTLRGWSSWEGIIRGTDILSSLSKVVLIALKEERVQFYRRLSALDISRCKHWLGSVVSFGAPHPSRDTLIPHIFPLYKQHTDGASDAIPGGAHGTR